MALFPDCRESAERLSRAQDAPLAPLERFGLRCHLLGCSGCRRFGAQLHVMRTAMRQWTARDD